MVRKGPAAHPGPASVLGRLRAGRWLLLEWVRRDVVVRYRQSLLGLAWALVQPLVLLAVYGVVFVGVLDVDTGGVPYVLFAYCGLAPWSFVATATATGVGSLVQAAPVVSKVWFPREVVPLAAVGVGLFDLAISTVVLLALAAVLGSGWHLTLLALPVVYLGLVLVVAAAVVLAAALTVFVRDVRQAVPLLLQVGFIATPVMYSAQQAPAAARLAYDLNPVAVAIGGVRTAVVDGRWPGTAATLGLVVVGGLLLWCALRYLAAVEGRFVDVL